MVSILRPGGYLGGTDPDPNYTLVGHTHTTANIVDAGTVAQMELGTTAGTVAAGDRDYLAYAPVFNVRKYGATGDGVADDTAAIQAAIDAANTAGGGTVYFPKGIYAVASTVNTSGLGVPLRLDGPGATLKATANNVPLAVNGTDIEVLSLTLDADSKCSRGLRVVAGSSGIALRGLTVQNVTQPAGDTLQAAGIRIEDDCHRVLIDGCTVYNVTAPVTGVARGILISNVSDGGVSTGITIVNNHIEEVGPVDDGDGIVVQDWTDRCYLTIANNRFKRCYKRAVKIMAPGVSVTGNTVENPWRGSTQSEPYPYAAISIYQSDCVVANNLLLGGTWQSPLEVGSGTNHWGRISLIGNVVYIDPEAEISATDLVRVYGIVDDLVIQGNRLSLGRYGIHLGATVTRCSITGNVISDTTGAGIYMDGGAGGFPTFVTISGNAYKDIGTYFIAGSASVSNVTALANGGSSTYEQIQSGMAGSVTVLPDPIGRKVSISVTSGIGLQSTATTGQGVKGVSTSSYGVWGYSTESQGVRGESGYAEAVRGVQSGDLAGSPTAAAIAAIRNWDGGGTYDILPAAAMLYINDAPTNILSPPTNPLVQAQVDGVDQFVVGRTGAVTATSYTGSGAGLTGLTKTQVGLADVDNTSDANKPISTATQSALDLKANLASPTFTGTVNVASLLASTGLNAPYVANTSTANNSRIAPENSGTRISTAVAANVALKVQNSHATITGDLQQWQTASTTPSRIDKDGGATFPTLKLTAVSEYADNAAALAGGLTAGAVYRTGDLLKVVHA